MPQPNKIPLAFAASGDKNAIPENTETTGLASWREGFPAITSAPFSEGGIAPKRADFNGIFNALSQAVMWLQQGGVYAYDVNLDYEAGNVVFDAGGLYVANSANGPSSAVVQPSSDTTGATWKLVRLDLATPIAAGYMSAEDKTKVDSVILTNATQSAAGYMSAEDKTKLDSVILTNATQSVAGYMSAEDKTALDNVPTTYLPLSGGTLTGNLTLSQVLSFSSLNPVVNSGGADHYLRLGNGNTDTLYANGASLYLYGAATTEEIQGGFNLQTFDGTNRATLSGRPDGTLTWDGKDIVLATLEDATDVKFNSLNIANNTLVNCTSAVFSPGVYLLIGTCAFGTNPTGYRQLGFSLSSTSAFIDRYSYSRCAACSDSDTTLQVLLIRKFTTSTTLYLNARQTSGSSLACSGGILYRKIA